MTGEPVSDPYLAWRRRAEAAEARVKQLSSAIDTLFLLVQDKGQPLDHPTNKALIEAGDTISVSEGALWNLRWVFMAHSPTPATQSDAEVTP